MFQKIRNSSGIAGFLLQNSGLITYGIMTVALIGFEMFNYSTTQYALNDVLGELTFAGLQWATILSIAFCGIDFAGIARLFVPSQNDHASQEVGYLFGAWLLAATMNAILTWWGVSMALQGHQIQSTAIIDKKLMVQVVPIFVAVMVWVTRVLLIGSFSMAGRHAAAGKQPSVPARAPTSYRTSQPAMHSPVQTPAAVYERPKPAAPVYNTHPQPTPSGSGRASVPARPEPEYIPDGDSAPSASPLPALRPMTASAHPSAGNQERRF